MGPLGGGACLEEVGPEGVKLGNPGKAYIISRCFLSGLFPCTLIPGVLMQALSSPGPSAMMHLPWSSLPWAEPSEAGISNESLLLHIVNARCSALAVGELTTHYLCADLHVFCLLREQAESNLLPGVTL